MKTNITFKKTFAFMAAIVLAATMASCGSSEGKENTAPETTEAAVTEDPEEKAFEEAAEKLDKMSESMTDEELEKALEKGNLDLDIDDEPKETEPVDTTPQPKYAPTEEILNADFTSGLIQIGNDVFQCGGYITLREFVEKYGDRWQCSNEGFNLDTPITDIDKTGIWHSDELGGYYTFKNGTLIIEVGVLDRYKDLKKRDYDALFKESSNLYSEDETKMLIEMDFGDCSTIESSPENKYWVAEFFAGFHTPDISEKLYKKSDIYEYPDNATIGDLIVINIAPQSSYENVFYPSGINAISNPDFSEEEAKNFFDSYIVKSNEIFDLISIPYKSSKDDLRKVRGVSTVPSMLHISNLTNGKIIKADEGYTVAYYKNITLGNNNLLGDTPTLSIVYFKGQGKDKGQDDGSIIRYSEYEFTKDHIYIPSSTIFYV